MRNQSINQSISQSANTKKPDRHMQAAFLIANISYITYVMLLFITAINVLFSFYGVSKHKNNTTKHHKNLLFNPPKETKKLENQKMEKKNP